MVAFEGQQMCAALRKVLKRLQPTGRLRRRNTVASTGMDLRHFERAIDLHDVPEKITIDKSGANTAAVHGPVADSGAAIELRQSKYLNNLVEQDHRAVKRRTRPMLGFKDFRSAAKIIAGIETMHMIRKGQIACPEGQAMSAAQQLYSLAF